MPLDIIPSSDPAVLLVVAVVQHSDTEGLRRGRVNTVGVGVGALRATTARAPWDQFDAAIVAQAPPAEWEYLALPGSVHQRSWVDCKPPHAWHASEE